MQFAPVRVGVQQTATKYYFMELIGVFTFYSQFVFLLNTDEENFVNLKELCYV